MRMPILRGLLWSPSVYLSAALLDPGNIRSVVGRSKRKMETAKTPEDEARIMAAAERRQRRADRRIKSAAAGRR